jgi:hypothetical protein
VVEEHTEGHPGTFLCHTQYLPPVDLSISNKESVWLKGIIDGITACLTQKRETTGMRR